MKVEENLAMWLLDKLSDKLIHKLKGYFLEINWRGTSP